jgi:outer membrane protein OmpA-like peptidoglycan-associated protein
VRPFLFVACWSIACAHAAPRAVTLTTPSSDFVPAVAHANAPSTADGRTDAREWTALADSLCKEAGSVEYGDDVSFSLARESFFDDKDSRLHDDAASWLARVAATFAKLPKGATLVMTSTLEEEATSLPPVTKIGIANRRAAAIHDALVIGGVDPSHLIIHATTSAWEGSYDGPATLDPAGGRVSFAVTR